LFFAVARPFGRGGPTISAQAFDRLGTTADTWQARLQKLSKGRLLGRFFAASRLGLRRVPNLSGCPAT